MNPRTDIADYKELGGTAWAWCVTGSCRWGEVEFRAGGQAVLRTDRDDGHQLSSWRVSGVRQVSVKDVAGRGEHHFHFNDAVTGFYCSEGGTRGYILSAEDGKKDFFFNSSDEASAPHEVPPCLDGASPGDWLTFEFITRVLMGHVGDDAGLFDPRHDRDYAAPAGAATGALARRGGVLYRRPPPGWKRVGLRAEGQYADGDAWLGNRGRPGEWAVAYHGTSLEAAAQIIREGFRVGVRHGAASCGLRDTRTGQPIGKGVYASPNLCVAECFANGEEKVTGRPPACVDGHTLWFVLQCRVRPGAICRPDNDGYTRTSNDEEASGVDGVFEWVVEVPGDIRPYGVLVRDRGSARGHQPKVLLKPSYARTTLPSGAFKHVQGHIDRPAQEAAEREQLKLMGRLPAPNSIPSTGCCVAQ
mmetsp:Transcript_79674/g.225546  ORF Transcript_79674/g.225546 Transcript_79674/m.225546 type:complete len:416 (-) Transcript_79674:74-1321(-)